MSKYSPSSASQFDDAEPDTEAEEKKRPKFSFEQIQKLAEQLARQRGGEVRDFMAEAHRILLDERLIAAAFQLSATYLYVNRGGKTLYQVYRYEHPDIKKVKYCPIRHLATDGSLLPGPGLVRVPYRLNRFDDDGLMLYVEGENKADRLAALGFKATTMAGQKWSIEAAYSFKGQDVVIIEDNDEPGRKNAAKAAAELRGFARSIRRLKLPGLGRSEDIIDWLQKGRTKAELKELIEAAPKSGIVATPRLRLDPKNIPTRDWISRPNYIRKFGSMLIAPGAGGKSSLVIVEAIALASGKKLLNIKPVKSDKYRVWYICGEDGPEELDRRFTAAMMFYGVTNEDVRGNLFYDSGRTMPVTLAQTSGPTKLQINEDVIDEMVETIKKNKIDVLILDPFIDFHRARENVNEDMDPIIKRLNAIAEECNLSYVLVHHTRKPNGNALTVDDARGASAAMNAARTARVINTMTQIEAEKAGIAAHVRRFYFSTYFGKPNLAPPTEAREWYELKSFDLENGDGFEVESDNIAVVTNYNYPSLELPTEQPSDIFRVAEKMRAGGPWLRGAQSKKAWVGIPIAAALGINIENPPQREAIKKRIKAWLAKGLLKAIPGKTANGDEREFIEVGELPKAEGQTAPKDEEADD